MTTKAELFGPILSKALKLESSEVLIGDGFHPHFAFTNLGDSPDAVRVQHDLPTVTLEQLAEAFKDAEWSAEGHLNGLLLHDGERFRLTAVRADEGIRVSLRHIATLDESAGESGDSDSSN